MLDGWKVIQAFLNEEPNDSVRVEYEVRPVGIFVADDPVATLVVALVRAIGENIREKSNELRGLGQNLDIVERDFNRDSGSGLLAL